VGHREKGRLLVLDAGVRAEFLLTALSRADLRRLCRKLEVSFPGYRLEKVEETELAEALADRYEEDPRAAATIDLCLDEECRMGLVIPEEPLPAPLVELLVEVTAAPPSLLQAPILWALFSHPALEVREAAAEAYERHLDRFAEILERMEEALPDVPTSVPSPPAGKEHLPRNALRRHLNQAEERAAGLAREREALQEQLSESRRTAALKDGKIAEMKQELSVVREELRAGEEARALLAARVDRDAVAEARLRTAEAERLAREAGALRRDLSDARRREAELTARVREMEKAPVPQPPRVIEQPSAEPADPWLLPVFSGEFYDSVRGWDPRVLQTAFEKALLLAQSRSHPGLDAKPMHGVEGLYRIYVARDVRLFYRRSSDGRLEILSLVDREDLDRYIRAYKSRLIP